MPFEFCYQPMILSSIHLHAVENYRSPTSKKLAGRASLVFFATIFIFYKAIKQYQDITAPRIWSQKNDNPLLETEEAVLPTEESSWDGWGNIERMFIL